MTETAEQIEDRLADFTRDKRILLLSLMAVVVGVFRRFRSSRKEAQKAQISRNLVELSE